MTLKNPLDGTGRLMFIKVRGFSRVLKNKYQAVSQGAGRFGKRSIFANM